MEKIIITEDLLTVARHFMMQLYNGQKFASLAGLWAHLFISSSTKDLRSLPPTEATPTKSFICHNIIVQKSHIAISTVPEATKL